jgi:mono/diheme cytochrome c family protein
VKTGIGPMPPFADKLTPEQIEAVADYVSKTAGK